MTETQDGIAALATKHKGLRETVRKIELELAKGVADLREIRLEIARNRAGHHSDQ